MTSPRRSVGSRKGPRTDLSRPGAGGSPRCSPSRTGQRIWAATAPQDTIDERFFAIVTDLVGTPTELVSPDDEIAWRTRSTVWGNTVWNRDASAHTPLRFPGQYHDAETGLHYNHHRHYDPETARYTSPDPLGLLPAPNPVAYVHNPHTWSDPLGLAPLCHLHGGDTGSPGGLGVLPGPAPQKAADMLDKVNALPGGKYKEWDVNAKVGLPACSAPGCGKEIRGPERLLTPKDGPGPAYYTPDHYGTFYYVGEFTG